MKRFLTIFFALLISVAAHSRGFGIVAGMTGSNASIKNFNTEGVGQYHFGVAVNMPLFGGFSLQPEILYNKKGAELKVTDNVPVAKVSMGFLELGAQLQLNLWNGNTRLYGFAEPFFGYSLNDRFSRGDLQVVNRGSNLRKPEGGFALGAGFQLFDHLQASAKFFWNLGPLYDAQGSMDLSDVKSALVNDISALFKDGNNFNGLSLSLAYFF